MKLTIATLLSVTATLAATSGLETIVKIDSGWVAGSAGAVRSYKGVPFAAPPVGDLRWKPPQPVKAWDGVRAGTEFGLACPQPRVFLISNDINHLDEDCLNLNLWTPAEHTGKRLPVMVWIHGGA